MVKVAELRNAVLFVGSIDQAICSSGRSVAEGGINYLDFVNATVCQADGDGNEEDINQKVKLDTEKMDIGLPGRCSEALEADINKKVKLVSENEILGHHGRGFDATDGDVKKGVAGPASVDECPKTYEETITASDVQQGSVAVVEKGVDGTRGGQPNARRLRGDLRGDRQE